MSRGIYDYEKTDNWRNRSSSGFYTECLRADYLPRGKEGFFLTRGLSIIVEPVTNTPLSTPHIVIVPQLEPLAMLRSVLRSSGKRIYALHSTDSAQCNHCFVDIEKSRKDSFSLSHSLINSLAIVNI